MGATCIQRVLAGGASVLLPVALCLPAFRAPRVLRLKDLSWALRSELERLNPVVSSRPRRLHKLMAP